MILVYIHNCTLQKRGNPVRVAACVSEWTFKSGATSRPLTSRGLCAFWALEMEPIECVSPVIREHVIRVPWGRHDVTPSKRSENASGSNLRAFYAWCESDIWSPNPSTHVFTLQLSLCARCCLYALRFFAARPFILLPGYAGFHAYRTVYPAKPSSDWNKSVLAAMDGCSRLASCRVALIVRVNN